MRTWDDDVDESIEGLPATERIIYVMYGIGRVREEFGENDGRVVTLMSPLLADAATSMSDDRPYLLATIQKCVLSMCPTEVDGTKQVLALLLSNLSRRVRPTDVDTAVACCTLLAALSEVEKNSFCRPVVLGHFANALRNRYYLRGDHRDLDAAIVASTECVSLFHTTAVDMEPLWLSLFRLADLYMHRFDDYHNIIDINNAIIRLFQVVELVRDSEKSFHIRGLIKTGRAYNQRYFFISKDAKDLSLAIEMFSEASQLLDGEKSPDEIIKSSTKDLLVYDAWAHRYRYEEEGEIEDLNIAIEECKTVLLLHGSLLSTRIHCTGNPCTRAPRPL